MRWSFGFCTQPLVVPVRAPQRRGVPVACRSRSPRGPVVQSVEDPVPPPPPNNGLHGFGGVVDARFFNF